MVDWPDTALLLVGHGSSRNDGGRRATLALAEAARRRAAFAEVAACFLAEPPGPSLDLVRARRVVVVPHLAGRGYFTERLIPERLGLPRADGREVMLAAPLGTHPAVPGLLASRALALCGQAGVDPAATALLVVAHGSSRPGRGSDTPEPVAAALRRLARFAEVRAAYLEQPPLVADWPALVAAPNVIALPLLISEGMHATEDLPPLFGLQAAQGGPVIHRGRRVWLTGGLGGDDELVDMILDLARAALLPAGRPGAIPAP